MVSKAGFSAPEQPHLVLDARRKRRFRHPRSQLAHRAVESGGIELHRTPDQIDFERRFDHSEALNEPRNAF